MQGLGTPKIVGAVLLVALVVAMVLNTKFVTSKELASLGPTTFNPEKTAATLFKKAGTEFGAQAAPLAEVVTAIQADPKAAAEKYQAVKPNADTLVISVTATGTVTEATAESFRLKVDGVPAETQVLVPVATALNGSVLRDALGFKFADAPGQSAFQFVGDELKKLMQAAVSDSVGDPVALKGKQVTVLGVINVVGEGAVPKAKPVSIQPVSVKEGS